jgi:hypothetical protein
MKIALVAAFVLALPACVLALGTETFGNSPVIGQPDWGEGVLDVVNLNSRVYSVWVNGNERFFYRGHAGALNEALGKYAAIKGDIHEVILLPGAGKTRSFKGTPIDFDWLLHVPSGIYKAVTKKQDAVLTIYINCAPSEQPLDRKQIDKWIEELYHDKFAVRENATQELAKLGPVVKPVLRDALKGNLRTLEGRRRIEALLDRLQGIALADLEIPKGIKLIDADDLVARNLQALKNTDPTQRSLAIQELSGFAVYSEKVVPALAEMLKKDRNEHVRRCAAAGLAWIGGQARPALAVLKKGLGDPDAYVRDACQRATDAIEKAKDTPGSDEERKRRRSIVKAISKFKSQKNQP